MPMTHQYVLDRLQQPGVELGLQDVLRKPTASFTKLSELSPNQRMLGERRKVLMSRQTAS
jgi:hypothetical protein